MSQKASRIPPFATIEAEAEFWDSHDSAEFKDEFEPVTDVRFVPSRRRTSITLRLDADTLHALSEQAQRQGVNRSALVRQWIAERLDESSRSA